jgi:hypothetical protein
MKIEILVTMLISLFAGTGFTQDSVRPSTENKNVTIIHATSTADGKSDVSERILEECIISLPKAGDLDPVIGSNSEYLKEINGDPSKNEFVKTYSATLDINYMLYQKVLVIVATSSVQGQEPVMKVMEKNLKQSKHFESNPANGDLFAGRSHRQYYFSTQNAAKDEVVKQATAWMRQQSAVVCANK